jgi:hypothetical protein
MRHLSFSFPTAPFGGRHAAEVVAPLAVLVSVRTSEEHRHPDREPAKGQQLSVKRPARSPEHTSTRQRGLWFSS